MKQEKWAERLENHLKNYREEPQRDLWEGIEAALDKKASQHARVVSLRRWMVAASLVGVLSGGAYLLWNHSERDDTIAPSPALAEASVQNDIIEPAITIADSSRTTISKPVSCAYKPLAQATEKEELDITDVKSEVMRPTSEPAKQTETSKEKVEQKRPHHDYLPERTIGRRPQPSSRRVTMNLYASSALGDYNHRNGVEMSPSLLSNFAMTRSEAASTRGDVVYLVGYEERQSHDHPISFGLTLSYPLAKRLALSSGLVYTKLNSDFLTIMQSNQVSRHQTLHYIGVPLNIQFSFWRWHGLNTYLSAGGLAEWNVKATANTDGVDQEMKKDRMQWSVNGSVGLQYDIIPQFGIYAESGVRHYFDNGSNVSNFYKDKPTSLNLQLGLRLNLGK